MSLTNCPHCTSPIPEAFAAMPVCSICGGDLKSAPASPVWASIDIKTDNTRTCHSCGSSVKSILALECPNCGVDLAPAGKVVEDINKEKEAFESAVKSSNASSNTATQRQPVQESKPQQSSRQEPTYKSSTSGSDIKPYSEMKKEKKEDDFVSIKDKKKKKEGFLARLLRMLGLKK